MSKSNTFENALLALIFNATPIVGLADVELSSQLGVLYASLHTADPGETGTQATSECAYTSYARVAVNRDATGFTVTGNSVSPFDEITFPAATAGSETATHAAIGMDASGAGTILYKGTITPNIVISASVTPILTTASAITEE